jgi:hypothetical protein
LCGKQHVNAWHNTSHLIGGAAANEVSIQSHESFPKLDERRDFWAFEHIGVRDDPNEGHQTIFCFPFKRLEATFKRFKATFKRPEATFKRPKATFNRPKTTFKRPKASTPKQLLSALKQFSNASKQLSSAPKQL